MNSKFDAAGYPVRNEGDRLRFKSTGRSFVVVKNLGLAVLCPCPDTLLVRFSNGDELRIDNSLDIEPNIGVWS